MQNGRMPMRINLSEDIAALIAEHVAEHIAAKGIKSDHKIKIYDKIEGPNGINCTNVFYTYNIYKDNQKYTTYIRIDDEDPNLLKAQFG